MNTTTMPRPVRRPLAAVAGDVRRGTQPTARRLLARAGRKSVAVAAFGSNI